MQPKDWNYNDFRNTYLTQQECLKHEKNSALCIKIDKRLYLTENEWNKDNCSISEHKWKGKK